METTIRVAKTHADFGKIFVLRYKIFTVEQGFSEDIEIDEHDDTAVHLIADAGSRAMGTLRLFKNKGDIILGRMAVEKEARATGLGRKLVRRAIIEARKMGGKFIIAHAQVQALGFYMKLGFVPFGDEFDEDGTPHRLVRCAL
jgi:predicted GNAT family N-acyltransferase